MRLYTKDYKHEEFHAHGLENSLLFVNMEVVLRIPAGFVAEINKLILKFLWTYKRPPIAKGMLKNKKIGEVLDFRTSYKCTIVKTVW